MPASYNVPAGTLTLAQVLANGNDCGTATITANSGAQTLWDGTNHRVPNVSVQGLKNLGSNALSAYPLAVGTDIPAASKGNYLAAADPAAKLSAYPLAVGTDVGHDTAAGVGAIADTAPAASISAYPLVPGADVKGISRVVAKAVETELTATTATQIATYTPTAAGIFAVKAVARIITATTTLSLSVTWDDPAGTAQTYTWENAANLPVGYRLELPVVAAAGTSAAITVSATAGTANQAYISASIEELV